MKRWFDSLPVHRKLVVMALLVTGTALLAATFGLTVFDVWRYRAAAADDIKSLAQVIAENSAAAVLFKDAEIAKETLATARVRPVVTRICLHSLDGSLFEGYNRQGRAPCDATIPTQSDWRVVSYSAPVIHKGRRVGMAYAERDLSDLGARIAATVVAGLTMLLLAALLAYAVAQRVHRTVSEPIVQLASAARTLGTEQHFPPRASTQGQTKWVSSCAPSPVWWIGSATPTRACSGRTRRSRRKLRNGGASSASVKRCSSANGSPAASKTSSSRRFRTSCAHR